MSGQMPSEEWRPVAGFPGYEVSNLGRILSHVKPKSPRLIQPWKNTGGYPSVTLWRDGKNHTRAVHRLVVTAFIGEREADQVTRHLDGDKWNNAVTNLTLGSQSENVVDMVKHGKHHKAVVRTCPQDHPYDDANTYVYKDGARRCHACRRAASRRYWHKKTLAAAGVKEQPDAAAS